MTQQNTRKPLPVLPSLTTRIHAWVDCRCGCGQQTQRTFAPGHDARLKGLIVRVVRGVMTLQEIEEWGGERTRKAVEEGIADKALLRRWNIEIPTVEVENVA